MQVCVKKSKFGTSSGQVWNKFKILLGTDLEQVWGFVWDKFGVLFGTSTGFCSGQVQGFGIFC